MPLNVCEFSGVLTKKQRYGVFWLLHAGRKRGSPYVATRTRWGSLRAAGLAPVLAPQTVSARCALWCVASDSVTWRNGERLWSHCSITPRNVHKKCSNYLFNSTWLTREQSSPCAARPASYGFKRGAFSESAESVFLALLA